jgi:hypothetical protein
MSVYARPHPACSLVERIPRNILSRFEPLNRSSRRESALTVLDKMERTYVRCY